MKNLLKKLGKYFFDISKILLAVAVITPFVKDENISILNLFLTGVLVVIGAFLSYNGLPLKI